MSQTNKVYEIAEFKALTTDGDAPGTFSAMVSVFGNVDLQGDIVQKGAFDADLKRWEKSGDPIPCVWSHDWADPFAHIGFVDPKNIQETDRGLLVRGQLDVDTNPFAKQVYDLMKQRRIKEFSFAYDIQDEGPSREVKGANDLRQISIIEVGPTLKGANPETELLGVKAELAEAHKEAEIKTPAKLSAKNRDRLESMHATLLTLGYDGCTSGPASKSDPVKVEVQEDRKWAEESDRDKDLRLQTLLAEMSE